MKTIHSQEELRCPKCGSVINEENHYRCSRFPVCTYTLPKEDFDINTSSFIVFDLETTGLDKRLDRIIEIGAIRVENGKVVDTFSQLLNPGKTLKGTQIYISNEITNITGITNKDVEHMPVESEGVARFVEWCADVPLVIGHNINTFDLPFLDRACKRANSPFPFLQSIDTLRFVRQLQMKKRGLIANEKQETLAKYYHIEYNAHRALDDVQALFKILKQLVKEGDPVIRSLSED